MEAERALGRPRNDTIWVVDPSHFGIHALKLSALKQGRIERLVAADTSGLDHEAQLPVPLRSRTGQRLGKPVAYRDVGKRRYPVMGRKRQSSGTIDAYSRELSRNQRMLYQNVTGSWIQQTAQSYNDQRTRISRSPFGFDEGIDVSGGPRTIRGIWASTGRVWVSGPSSGLSAGMRLRFQPEPNGSDDPRARLRRSRIQAATASGPTARRCGWPPTPVGSGPTTCTFRRPQPRSSTSGSRPTACRRATSGPTAGPSGSPTGAARSTPTTCPVRRAGPAR